MNKLLVISLVMLTACSSFIDKRAASSTYRILAHGNAAARRVSDIELAREAAASGVVQLATFADAYPDERRFRDLHARAICDYAIGFVFDDWEAASLGGQREDAHRVATRLDSLLTTCIDTNLALLRPSWRAALADNDRWTALLRTATAADAPALLDIASAEAVRVALDPLGAGIARLKRALATLARCTELAPGIHDAQAELLLGSLRAGTSRFFGGPDGEDQLAAARRLLGPSAMIVDVTYARSVAVARQDRQLFLRLLDRVLAADLTRWPDNRLANELARRKAQRYRAAVDALIPAPPAQ